MSAAVHGSSSSSADNNAKGVDLSPSPAAPHGASHADRPFFLRPVEVGPVLGAAGAWVGGTAVGDAAREESSGHGAADRGSPDDQCQDVGNVVLLEHVNLEVPDLEVARLFYGEGLGLAADPATTGVQRGGNHVVWYNCGRQQFHIARGPAPQRLPPGAVVGLVMPDVAAVAERMEAVRQILGDVSLTYARGDTLEAVDPYGNTFAVHSSLPYFPGRQGIAYLQLPCFLGTAAAVAQFYAARLGARARVSGGGARPPYPTSSGSGGGGGASAGHGSPQRAEVWMGPGQKLLFVEQAQLGPVSDEAVAALFGGWHIAMYVADFSRTYRAVHFPDVLPFNEHPYRDKYHSLHDALRNRQFRFQDITALPPYPDNHDDSDHHVGSGQQSAVAAAAAASASASAATQGPRLVYRVSHEVRSMHHPSYGRALYNRDVGFV